MTPRENYLATLNGEKHDHVPNYARDVQMLGVAPLAIESPFAGGKDAFGVPWVITPDGAMSEPGFVLFDDVADWREYVHFPDLDAIDFKSSAEQELAVVDRNEKLTEVPGIYGIFMRLVYFMGFENALMAFAEDPESCAEFFDACADYHVDFINRLCEAYHPDAFSYIEDIATARSLFISPKSYREIVKPYHKKVFDAIKANGAIPVMHTCGYCSDIIEDYVDVGVRIWTCAQPCNDIAKLLDQYEGKLMIEGGWDTQGHCSQVGATIDEIKAEVGRCMQEYGLKSFSMFPLIMNERGNALVVGDDRLPVLFEEMEKWDKKLFGEAG